MLYLKVANSNNNNNNNNNNNKNNNPYCNGDIILSKQQLQHEV